MRRALRLLVVLAVLGAVAFAVLRGPDLYRRFSHPLDHMQLIADESAANGVDPYLVAAVINTESGFRDGVVSSAGAVGLMQVMPTTAMAVAARIGLNQRIDAAALSDPGINIRIGTAYLAELIARYDGSVELALAAYNAGITNADEWAAHWKRSKGSLSAVIDFPQTAHYVDEVDAQVAAYRELYPDAFPKAGK
jgi:soluble lytic murein transglycosylase